MREGDLQYGRRAIVTPNRQDDPDLTEPDRRSGRATPPLKELVHQSGQ
jgi:hypothetical protein